MSTGHMASAWGTAHLLRASQPGLGVGGPGTGGRHGASPERRKPELFTFLITGAQASAQPGVIPTDKVNRM